jgi:hypothetical protein
LTARRCGIAPPAPREVLRRLPRQCGGEHGGRRRALPVFDAAQGRPVDLEQSINRCRVEHQKAAALPFESKDLLALAAYFAAGRLS